MPAPVDPMVPHLVDLESDYDVGAARSYDPRDLIRFALTASDYWADLALRWMDQGAPGDGLEESLLDLENQGGRPQPLRHHARRLRRSL